MGGSISKFGVSGERRSAARFSRGCGRKVELMCIDKESDGISGGMILPIWQADSSLACSLIGCCLSCTERKQLLRKLDIPVGRLTSFGIYELLAHAVRDENALSQRINQMLRHRLEPETGALRTLDEEAFLRRCREDFAAGTYFPGLWVAATRPDLSPESRHELAGLVQMAMLGAFDEVLSARRRIAELVQKNTQQTRKVRELRLKLERTQAGMEHELARLRERESLCAEQLAKANELRAWSERGPALETENRELHDMLEEALDLQTAQEARIKALTEELERTRTLREICPEGCTAGGAGCDAGCPAFNLCSKRVLIVGGVERMEPQYRTLVERCGGILDYHDGKMQGGARKLEKSLQRADIIICPVNCNSHGACLMVKSLAKKHRKVVHMLPNASISTVTRVFGEVVNAD